MINHRVEIAVPDKQGDRSTRDLHVRQPGRVCNKRVHVVIVSTDIDNMEILFVFLP